jgi:hypothetical protein
MERVTGKPPRAVAHATVLPAALVFRVGTALHRAR